MRISDWSSDVCSSDLEGILADLDHILAHAKELNMRLRYEVRQPLGDLLEGGGRIARTIPPIAAHGGIAADAHEIAHAADIAGQRCEKTRSEEHTSELQSLMRISYAVFCLKKKTH